MSDDTVKWGARPQIALCSHYFGAHFEEISVRLLAANGTSCESMVTWAVGVLTDGDWEVMGAWRGVAVGPAFWYGIWEDLDSRGVDKISMVCALDLDARALCPLVKVLPSFPRILGQSYVPVNSSVGMLRAAARRTVRQASGVLGARIALKRLLVKEGARGNGVLSPDWSEVLESFRPFYALRPHRRALVRAGDEYLEQLACSLSRAVGRHGPFADLPAAVSFVAKTLSRDELRLKHSKLPKFARPVLRLVGADVSGRALLSSYGGGC